MGKAVIGKERGQPFVARDGALIFELFRGTRNRIQNMSLATGYLKPGQKAIPHWHEATEEIYFIISGAGHVKIKNRWYPIKAGQAAYVPKGAMHALWNTSRESLKVLAICSPPYEDGDAFFEE